MKTRRTIKRSDMAKGTRTIGCLIRALMPCFSVEDLRMQNRMMGRFVKGHWLSQKTSAQTICIPREDGTTLRILVCRSKKTETKNPATGLLWMHGGGYAIGLPEQDFLFANLFCKDGSCVAVLPEYTRSTDAPYPAALEDCYLALCWMWEHADELGIDRRQIFVGGDSAGGGLTAALCLYARDKGQIPIAFQMPLYPMLDDREITPSSKDNDAPVWNTASNRAAWAMYLGDMKDEIPCYAAPARCTDYSNLPPACTYIGTIEPFHDETIAYFSELEKAGTPIHLKEFEGCYHAFDLMAYPMKPAKEARSFLRKTFKYAQEHYFTDGR